jgi:hypothetical protein
VLAHAVSRWYLAPAAGALGLVALASVSASASALGSVPVPTPASSSLHASAVQCSDAGSGPHRRESCLAVTAVGFAAGEPVRVREYLQPSWQRLVHADQHGRVRLRFQPPDGNPGRHDVLTFVGLGAPTGGAGVGGTVSVTVPRIAVYRFVAQDRDGDGH